MQKSPLDRPNQPTKPRHRHTNTRAHQAVYQRRTVARGSKVGPAELGVRPNQGFGRTPLKPVQVHFGGKAVLILLKTVLCVSMYSFGGNRPIQAI